jgi:hypothetical protein
LSSLTLLLLPVFPCLMKASFLSAGERPTSVQCLHQKLFERKHRLLSQAQKQTFWTKNVCFLFFSFD